jgi:hypothetical protein
MFVYYSEVKDVAHLASFCWLTPNALSKNERAFGR